MLGRRGTPILYVLGANDPGIEEMAEYFGSDGRRLRRQRNVTLRLLEGADHTLSAHSVRAALIQEMRDWCLDRFRQQNNKIQLGTADTPREPSGALVSLRSFQASALSPRK